MKALTIAALLVSPLLAQQKQPTKDPITGGAGVAYTTTLGFQPQMSITEDLSKGYKMVFDDPEGKWRCFMTSSTPEQPGNVIHTEPNSVTITCVKVTK